jgi:chromosome partitioning protein
VLTLNGLCAAKEVFIPLQPHYLALQGLGKLLETVTLVGRRINPDLKVSGVVVCMHDAGTKLANEVIDDVRGFLDSARGTPVPWADAKLFPTMIRRNIKLAEAPSYGKSIFDYAADSHGAKDYEQLAKDVDAQAAAQPAPPAQEPHHRGTESTEKNKTEEPVIEPPTEPTPAAESPQSTPLNPEP